MSHDTRTNKNLPAKLKSGHPRHHHQRWELCRSPARCRRTASTSPARRTCSTCCRGTLGDSRRRCTPQDETRLLPNKEVVSRKLAERELPLPVHRRVWSQQEELGPAGPLRVVAGLRRVVGARRRRARRDALAARLAVEQWVIIAAGAPPAPVHEDGALPELRDPALARRLGRPAAPQAPTFVTRPRPSPLRGQGSPVRMSRDKMQTKLEPGLILPRREKL